MFKRISESEFIDEFKAIRPENFSILALKELFQFYEDIRDNDGTEIELDVIAICCDWVEYTYQEALQEYENVLEGCEHGNLVELDECLSELTSVRYVSNPHGEDTILVEAF